MLLPFRVRQSTLEEARCLFRFHRNRILKLPEPEHEASRRGNDIHALAKKYVDFLVASKQEMDWSYGEDLIREGDWQPEAAAVFKSWIQNRIFDPSKVFATEYQIRLDWQMRPCEDPEKIVYSSDIDRLDIESSHADIWDYKSHFGVFEPTTIQAIFYPWILWKVMPHLETITFNLDFVRWNTVRTREFTREHLEQMDQYMKNQVDRLVTAWKADEWPASINSQCVYCHHDCPLVAAGLTRNAVGQIQSEDQAKQMAQELYAMMRTSKQIQASLRNYAMQNGTIKAANDIEIGFKRQDRKKYNVEAIVKLNKKYGFSPHRALVVAAKELAKIGKNYPEYVTEANAFCRDASTTAFKFSNEKGDPLSVEEEEDV